MGLEFSNSAGEDKNLLARVDGTNDNGSGKSGGKIFPVLIRRPTDHLTSEMNVILEELDITFTSSKSRISKIGFPGVMMLRTNSDSQMVKVGIDDENEGKFLLLLQFKRSLDQRVFCEEMTRLLPNHSSKIVKESKFSSDVSRTYAIVCGSMEFEHDPFILRKLQDAYIERVSKLDLRNYQINSEKVYSPLFTSLRWNYGISVIDLSRTGINDVVVLQFCNEMKYNTSLRRLYLNGIIFEPISITEVGAGYLSSLITSESSRIEHLSLKNSRIGNNGAVVIFESLSFKKNKCMKSIDLSSNKLGDIISESVCSSVEYEESVLRRVNLEDNDLGGGFYKRIKLTLEKVDGVSFSFHGNPCFENNEMTALGRPQVMFGIDDEGDDLFDRVLIPFREIQFAKDAEESKEEVETTTSSTTVNKRSSRRREHPLEEDYIYVSEVQDEEEEEEEEGKNASLEGEISSCTTTPARSLISIPLPSVYEGFYRGISVYIRRVKVVGNISLSSHLKTESINVFSIQKHPGLVSFHGISMKDGCAYIVHEKTDTSLRNFLQDSSKPKLSLENRIRILIQIIEVIRYLFSKNARCSINSMNIFVQNFLGSPMIRLSDYGFSGISLCHYDFQGPEGFVFTPPELFHEKGTSVVRSGEHGSKSLVYSFGMVAFEILREKRPFHEVDVSERRKREKLMDLISGEENLRPSLEDLRKMYEEGENKDVEVLCELMRMCWEQEKKRPTVQFIRKFLLKKFVYNKKEKRE